MILAHAMASLAPWFHRKLLGIVGSGDQWMPWIHLDDVADIIVHTIHTPTLSGPIKVTAPQPVRHRAWMQALAIRAGQKWLPKIPTLALRLRYGSAASTLTASQRVLPLALTRSGYRFAYSTLDEALEHIFAPTGE